MKNFFKVSLPSESCKTAGFIADGGARNAGFVLLTRVNSREASVLEISSISSPTFCGEIMAIKTYCVGSLRKTNILATKT
jgi:hypothetical protein